jgi:cobalt-zinc-cadmium efflux system outer membrane protein
MMRFPALPLLLAALASPAWAEDAYLPPAAMVDVALASYPKVLAADARVRAAQAQARGLAAGPHEIELSGGYTRRDVRIEGLYDEFDASVRRAVRLPGKAALDRRAGDLGVRVAEFDRDEVRHQAALKLAESWFDWISATIEAEVQSATVSGHERELAGLGRRLEVQDASALELDQAKRELENARVALTAARGRAAAAHARIAALYPDLPPPAHPPALPDPSLSQAEAARLSGLSVERDHEVKAAAAEVERQNALAARARRDRMPDPNVGVRLFSERSRDEVGLGVVASIPLGGGRRAAASEEQLAQSHAAASELAALTSASRALAEAERITAISAIEAWRGSFDAMTSAGEVRRRQRIAYDAGAADMADLLYAERQAAEAARAEVVQRAEALHAITRLRINAHELWAASDHDADS